MDCYTKPKCPPCHSDTCCGQNPRPPFGPGVSGGPGPVFRPDTVMGPGPVFHPDTAVDLGTAYRPEVPMGPGPVIPSQDMERFPAAMAYVPWQRWQQVYPVDRALCRGTIFPDLDKPFAMGRCR